MLVQACTQLGLPASSGDLFCDVVFYYPWQHAPIRLYKQIYLKCISPSNIQGWCLSPYQLCVLTTVPM